MRFNIFNQIHKALRALLYDTALLLQQTNFSHGEEVEASLSRVRHVLDVFDKHAAHEDNSILPAIAEYEPALVDTFEREHEEDHEMAETLRALVASFENEFSVEGKMKAGQEILHAFIAFMTFNLEHMAKEETVLNERLWRYYTDAEIAEINHRIVTSIPHEEMAFTSAWMMKGLSNSEISRWMKEVQRNAPEFVFSALFSIAERELSHDRFRKILEDLTEGAMVA